MNLEGNILSSEVLNGSVELGCAAALDQIPKYSTPIQDRFCSIDLCFCNLHLWSSGYP